MKGVNMKLEGLLCVEFLNRNSSLADLFLLIFFMIKAVRCK